MNSSEINTAIFEISLNIGTSLDLNKVLKEAMTSYLRQLDCTGIAVLNDDFSILSNRPKVLKNDADLSYVIKYTEENLNDIQKDCFAQKNPYYLELNDRHFYIYSLESFGYLIFIKNQEPFSLEIVKALSQINEKFGNSIVACIEIEKYKEEQIQLLQQSKLISMGEMIANIAHQWRQPLSAITSLSSSMLAYKQMGMLDDETIDNNLNQIIKKSEYLSNTIETFRNFLKEEKSIKDVCIQTSLVKSLDILQSTLKSHDIKLKTIIDEKEDYTIKAYEGELSQSIINIVNNAKDALLERKVTNPWIKIELIKNEDHISITFEDNAGGIKESILPKIFNPYFTTKHQKQGTGLGLNMSYKIIKESLKGNLYVKNTKNGAKFFIDLPLSIEDK